MTPSVNRTRGEYTVRQRRSWHHRLSAANIPDGRAELRARPRRSCQARRLQQLRVNSLPPVPRVRNLARHLLARRARFAYRDSRAATAHCGGDAVTAFVLAQQPHPPTDCRAHYNLADSPFLRQQRAITFNAILSPACTTTAISVATPRHSRPIRTTANTIATHRT